MSCSYGRRGGAEESPKEPPLTYKDAGRILWIPYFQYTHDMDSYSVAPAEGTIIKVFHTDKNMTGPVWYNTEHKHPKFMAQEINPERYLGPYAWEQRPKIVVLPPKTREQLKAEALANGPKICY